MASVESQKWSPPYTSFVTLMNTISRMAEDGMPSRVDRSYLQNLPGGVRSTFMASMRSFGLVDAQQHPTTELKRMVEGDEGVRKETIADLMRAFYPDVLQLPGNATQSQLEDVFRAYGMSGSTLRKAVAFFLAGAKFADITVSPHFRLPRATGSSDRTRRKTTVTAPQAAPATTPGSDRTPTTRELGLHPFIEGLIRELPRPGDVFPEDKQDAWFAIAKATFRLIYPMHPGQVGVVVEPSPQIDRDEDEDAEED